VLPIALFRQYRALRSRRRRGDWSRPVGLRLDHQHLRTPLDSVLPAEPVGVDRKPFYAHRERAGKRHPVTRASKAPSTEPPHWSRFFRTVETRNSVTPCHDRADGKPLLLLSRFGEGRVALLLSDHIWLWAAAMRAAARIWICCGGCRTG